MDMYFRQFWRDPRLAFNGTPGLDRIVLTGESYSRFWTPDTFFVNEKESLTHKELSPNAFFRILRTGEVLLSKRYCYESNKMLLNYVTQ